MSGGGRRLLASSRQWSIASESSPPAPRRQRRPLDADEVAEVEVDQQLECLLAELVGGGVELDLAAAVAQVEEGRLAVAATGDDPPGDPVARVGLDPRRQPLVGRPDLGDLLTFLELVRERVDPGLAQPLQLLAPVAEDIGEFLLAPLARSSARAYSTAIRSRSW